MLMLSNAAEVSRDELYNVTTPEPTDTWKPVPHIDVVNTLTDRANERGLVIKNERFALLDGTLYGEGGIQRRYPAFFLHSSNLIVPLAFKRLASLRKSGALGLSCALRSGQVRLTFLPLRT